jgi:acetyl-CoA carboxylase biotin carboxyl carrier protein
MDFVEIQKLVELIESSTITEFELTENDLKIRISKNGAANGHVTVMQAPQAALPTYAAAPGAPSVPVAAAPARALHEIKSPMVGTFYRASSPDAEAYVRVGDMVENGRVLCIVEAMKLMNEIESEIRGRIVDILVENAQPVEFGQVLFRVDTTAA